MCINEIKELTLAERIELEELANQDKIQEHESEIKLLKQALSDFKGCCLNVNSSGNKKWATTTIRNMVWSICKDSRGREYVSVDCYVEYEDELVPESMHSINFYLDYVEIVMYEFENAYLNIIDCDGESIEFTEFGD